MRAVYVRTAIFLFLFIFLLVASSLVGVLSFYIVSKLNENNGKGAPWISNSYQYVSYNPTKQIFSSGLVSYPILLEDYETKKFETEEEYVMISNLGEDEYMCIGSCYCYDGQKRRNSGSQILRSGVVTLLTAVTSIIAFQKARDYFQGECEEEFQNFGELYCPSGSRIGSEVSNCLEMASEAPASEEKKEKKKEKWWETGEEPNNPKTFMCKGTCKEVEGWEVEEERCSSVTVMRTFVLDCWDVNRKSKCKQGKCVFAKKDFRHRFLDSICNQVKNDDGVSLCESDYYSVNCRLIVDTDDSPIPTEEPFDDDDYPFEVKE